MVVFVKSLRIEPATSDAEWSAEVKNSRLEFIMVPKSVFCCGLFAGGVLSGIYTMVAYGAAFGIEVWWVVEANLGLPAPAFLLAAGYFFTLLVSIFLMFGLVLKKPRCLLGWLFVMILFFLPECGLVLFMSLYHWGLEKPYGLIELIFYIFRAVVNIIAIVCVQSLFRLWREEKNVMRRLENLKDIPMFGTLAKHNKENNAVSSSHSYLSEFAYQNPRFQDSELSLANANTLNLNGLANNNLMVQSSLNSQRPVNSPVANGSATVIVEGFSHQDVMPPSVSPSPDATGTAYGWGGGVRSEFDAMAFQEYLTLQKPTQATVSHITGTNTWNGRIHSSAYSDLTPSPYRPHTFNGSQFHTIGRQSWNVPTEPETTPAYSTLSLDRAKFSRHHGGRGQVRAASLEALDVYIADDIVLEKLPEGPFGYLDRPGNLIQDDADSASAHSIRDIAL